MGVKLGMSGTAMASVTHDLERLRMNGQNMKPAMDRVAQVAVDAVRDQFRTQGRHFGAQKWVPLSARYKAKKLRTKPGRPMLVYSGELKKRVAPVLARNAGFYKANSRMMEVGVTYAQVPYAQYHQEGGKKLPARPIMGKLTREDQKAMTKVIHTHLVTGVVASVGR